MSSRLEYSPDTDYLSIETAMLPKTSPPPQNKFNSFPTGIGKKGRINKRRNCFYIKEDKNI